MLMGRLPGAVLAPELDLLALDPALLAWPAPWRSPGPLAPYRPLGLPATRAPELAASDTPAAAPPLAALMQRLAPFARDGTTGGGGPNPGAAPAAGSTDTFSTAPDQRPQHATANARPGAAGAGAAWEGIAINFPRARGLEDAGLSIFTAPLTMAAPPGVGTALAVAREMLTPPERQFRSLGPVVPGVSQTSQAMRAHWQKEGAIDARGNLARGGPLDPDGNGIYDSPAYRGQWDLGVAKERSPWRQAPAGAIGDLINAATGEVRRAESLAELAARARALTAAPPRVVAGRLAAAAAPSREAIAAAARASIAAQLARVGGSASSAFAGRGDGGAARGGSSAARAGAGDVRSSIGPRGRQGAR